MRFFGTPILIVLMLGSLIEASLIEASASAVTKEAKETKTPALTGKTTSSVGMSARLEQIVLPGSKLGAKPLADRRQPLILRIEQTYPHGSDFRYDLVYSGLEPGEYDLRDYLRREDGSPTSDLPPLTVKVATLLPPGQIEPHPLQTSPAPRLGGYRGMLVLGGILWCVGLAAILSVGHRRKAAAAQKVQQQLSLAQRLQNMVDLIVSGRFTESDKAQLELLLLAHWRKRLGLENAKPDEAMAAMRSHHEAAHLLDQLERWLYRPAGLNRTEVIELLRPYHNSLEEVFVASKVC